MGHCSQGVCQRLKRDQTKRQTNHRETFKAQVSGIPKVVGCLDFANDDHALDTYAPLTVGIVPRLCWEAQAKVLNNGRSQHGWLVPIPFDIVIPGFNAVLLYAGFMLSARISEKCHVSYRCVCQYPEDLFKQGVSMNIGQHFCTYLHAHSSSGQRRGRCRACIQVAL